MIDRGKEGCKLLFGACEEGEAEGRRCGFRRLRARQCVPLARYLERLAGSGSTLAKAQRLRSLRASPPVLLVCSCTSGMLAMVFRALTMSADAPASGSKGRCQAYQMQARECLAHISFF